MSGIINSMNAPIAIGPGVRVGRVAQAIGLGILVAVGFATSLSAETEDVVAVFSETFNGYHRTRNPDRSYRPETFTFARGGYANGPFADDSIDGLPFMKVVHTLAGPLRRQHYVAGTDPNKTDLIIFVYWGTTTGSMGHSNYSGALTTFEGALQAMQAGPMGPQTPFSTQGALQTALSGDADLAMGLLQFENYWRDRQNATNARLLGYGAALDFAWTVPWLAVSQSYTGEIEMNRYFVLLQAFDFQQLWKHKKWKPLWKTVYSIPQQGNRFDKELEYMTARATSYFGTSKGLIRDQVPEGSVQVGEPQVVPAAGTK